MYSFESFLIERVFQSIPNEINKKFYSYSSEANKMPISIILYYSWPKKKKLYDMIYKIKLVKI